MKLGKYSFGTGDRFARQGEAQLRAAMLAAEAGTQITPVWNKSHREHKTIHSDPQQTRISADAAVKNLSWQGAYYVDADHVNLETVDFFLDSSNFFTLDVADFIGRKAEPDDIKAFVTRNKRFFGNLKIDGIEDDLQIDEKMMKVLAEKYLYATAQAGAIYRHILKKKAGQGFVIEVSMDETDDPQNPTDILFILEALAYENIPVETIAPKFSGRFNKGVDYVGNVQQFKREFEQDLAVIGFAVKEFGLPESLKLSVHSGSDKFSIYPVIHAALQQFDAGVHIKTAGTTWLEELIGLALAGGDGLDIARAVYSRALDRYDELCGPYATVLDVDRSKLPAPQEVNNWDGELFAAALRHDVSIPEYNPHFRQLLHVAYKVAAELGDKYLDALDIHREIIAENVTENLFQRHIKPIFMGG